MNERDGEVWIGTAVTHVVAVAVGADLRLVDQGGLDVGQVPFLLRVAELGEDLLLVRVPLVFERDHLVRGAELRVSAARQLRHGSGRSTPTKIRTEPSGVEAQSSRWVVVIAAEATGGEEPLFAGFSPSKLLQKRLKSLEPD